MARLLQLMLQALHCHRSTPFRDSGSQNVTGVRQLACRWYGESALLEDSCSSSNGTREIDRDSVAASQGGEKYCQRLEGLKEEAIKEKLNGKASDNVSFKSLMDKLESSVSGKPKSKANFTANQGRMEAEAEVSEKSSTPCDESSKVDDIWQQVRSTIRNMSPKNAAKGAPGDESGVPKAGESVNQSEHASKQSVPKDLLFSTAFGKNSKRRNSQPQNPNQQKPKEAKLASFSFLKDTPARSENDFTSRSKPQDNLSKEGTQRSTDAMPGRVDNKLTRGPDSAAPSVRSAAMNASTGADMQGRSTSNIDVTSQSGTGYMVCVHGLPYNCNPAMVKAAMSTYGELAGTFKRSRRKAVLSVFVKYKRVEGMEAALAARQLQIDSRPYNIVRSELPKTTVVRLNRVSHETSENQLVSVCERFGGLDNIRKRGGGIYDIYYRVEELPNMSNILGSLNNININRSAWLAVPAPILHPAVRKEVLRSQEGQAWHEHQSNEALGRIEGGLEKVSVLFEDLKELFVLGKESSHR